MIFKPMPEDKETKLGQSHAAKLVDLQHWSSTVSTVGWHLKHAQKGLQPLRPIVIFSVDVTLETGKALILQN